MRLTYLITRVMVRKRMTRCPGRRFELADYVRVGGANLEDGLLVIDLIREVPEAMKPKKIAIGTQASLSLVEDGEARSQAA